MPKMHYLNTFPLHLGCWTTAEVKLVCFSPDHVTNQTVTLGVWAENHLHCQGGVIVILSE